MANQKDHVSVSALKKGGAEKLCCFASRTLEIYVFLRTHPLSRALEEIMNVCDSMHRLWEEQQQQQQHTQTHSQELFSVISHLCILINLYIEQIGIELVYSFGRTVGWLADSFIHLVSAKLSRNAISNYPKGSNGAERGWWDALSFCFSLPISLS